MRRVARFCGVLAVAGPLAVSGPDSSQTEFHVAGGRGDYAIVTRGCEGEVLSSRKEYFGNAGAEVSHKFTAPVRVGVRGGIVEPDRDGPTNRYWNPNVALEWSKGSIGLGIVRAQKPLDYSDNEFGTSPPSAHVRLGSPRLRFYMSFMEDVPLLTAGYYQLGFEARPGSRFAYAVGASALPYDGVGGVLKAEYRAVADLWVGATGRIGVSASQAEDAFAVGLTYRWTHRGEAPPAAVAPMPGAGAPREGRGDSPAAPGDSLAAPGDSLGR